MRLSKLETPKAQFTSSEIVSGKQMHCKWGRSWYALYSRGTKQR